MGAITSFELKKLIKHKSVLGGVIVAIIVFIGCFYVFFLKSQLSGVSGQEYYGKSAIKLNKKIAEDHSGPLTDKRISQIIDFRVRTANNEFRKNQFMDVFSWSVADTFIPQKDEAKFYGVKRVSRKGIKIIPVSRLGTKIPPSELKIGNFKPWSELFKLMGVSFIVIAVLTIYICSSVFSGDSSKNLLPLLLTTKYGRNKLTKDKLFAVFIISTFIFLITQIITIIYFNQYFIGFSGWDTSVQLNFDWNVFSFPLKMNFLNLLLCVLLFQYLGLLFTVFITALISNYTKYPATSLAVSLLAFFSPLILEQVFKGGIIYKILYFFPAVNTNVQKMMENLSLPGSLLFDSVQTNVIAITVFLILSIAICSGVIYKHSKSCK